MNTKTWRIMAAATLRILLQQARTRLTSCTTEATPQSLLQSPLEVKLGAARVSIVPYSTLAEATPPRCRQCR
jgi:hypothetical protein